MKAEENLRRAEYTRDPNEHTECLAESFRLFSKAAKDISPSKVAPIAKRYHDAGFTRGRSLSCRRSVILEADKIRCNRATSTYGGQGRPE